MKNIVTSLIILTTSAACSVGNYVAYNAQQIVRDSGLISSLDLHRGKNTILATNSRLYIAVSDDLIQQYRQYHATHDSQLPSIGGEAGVAVQAERLSRTLTSLLSDAANENFLFVRTGKIGESVGYALTRAEHEAADILLYPRISQYRDGVGSWIEIGRLLRRGSPQQVVNGFGLDKIRLELLIVDVSSAQLVDRAQLSAAGGLLTSYGDQPLELLKPAMVKLFEGLAGRG